MRVFNLIFADNLRELDRRYRKMHIWNALLFSWSKLGAT
jgi:hypothetical protein